MAANNALGEHLLRGVIGCAFFFGSSVFSSSHNVLISLALGLGGLITLRGCPLCWIIGLVKAITNRWRYIR